MFFQIFRYLLDENPVIYLASPILPASQRNPQLSNFNNFWWLPKFDAIHIRQRVELRSESLWLVPLHSHTDSFNVVGCRRRAPNELEHYCYVLHILDKATPVPAAREILCVNVRTILLPRPTSQPAPWFNANSAASFNWFVPRSYDDDSRPPKSPFFIDLCALVDEESQNYPYYKWGPMIDCYSGTRASQHP